MSTAFLTTDQTVPAGLFRNDDPASFTPASNATALGSDDRKSMAAWIARNPQCGSSPFSLVLHATGTNPPVVLGDTYSTENAAVTAYDALKGSSNVVRAYRGGALMTRNDGIESLATDMSGWLAAHNVCA